MKEQEKGSIQVLMYFTAIVLWAYGVAWIIAPLGMLTLFGVDTFAYAVMSPMRAGFGAPLLVLGVLAWDAARRPPRHIGMAALLGVYFLGSSIIRSAAMLVEGEVKPLSNAVLLGFEVAFGLAHAGWWYLWTGRKERNNQRRRR